MVVLSEQFMLVTFVAAFVAVVSRSLDAGQLFPDRLRAGYTTPPANGEPRASRATYSPRFQKPRPPVRDDPDAPTQPPGKNAPWVKSVADPLPQAPARRLLHSVADVNGPGPNPNALPDCLHQYQVPAERRARRRRFASGACRFRRSADAGPASGDRTVRREAATPGHCPGCPLRNE